ncbi:MAG TPA: aromatic-ring-hydroxylating dioxygenase subunit beta [Stellaceae bacterium]|nr:aromatic-ring-hydroxylating dioxygenase subunit beta [Stellaceae bacterium]
MADIATQLAVERLLARYVASIDEDRLEEWPGYFTEACHYQIISRENYEKGFPIGVFYADTRGMLQDRVAALREANIYEAQRYRHIVSATLIDKVSDGVASVRSNYLVLRIMQDGAMSLFSAGRYLDRVDLRGAEPLFQEKIVVFDNKRIDTLLAIPL